MCSINNDRAFKSKIPCQRGFKLVSLNINKLTSHIDVELTTLMACNDFDLVSINETKLNDTKLNSEVDIVGYNIIRRDRMVEEFVSMSKTQ